MHFKMMKGNECRKLLNNLAYLEEHIPQHLDGFRIAFQRFKELEDSCFASELDPYYTDRITEFRDAYLALNLPITSKVITCVGARGSWYGRYK